MPMQAYVDESGEKGQGSWLSLVGLVASAEEWALFADEWRAVLDHPPAISAWHMSDAAHFQQEFRRWSPAMRDERLRLLAGIVNRYKITALHASADIAAYAEFMAPLTSIRPPRKSYAARIGKVMHEQPYWICFLSIIMAVCYELVDQEVRERFEIIFDEKKILGPRVKAWYPATRSRMEPDEQAIMPIDPMFRDDKQFVPLQCADLLAWILNRDLIAEDGNPGFLSKVQGKDHTFGWVKKEMHGLVWSGHRQLFTKERLKGIREMAIRDELAMEAAVRLDSQLL